VIHIDDNGHEKEHEQCLAICTCMGFHLRYSNTVSLLHLFFQPWVLTVAMKSPPSITLSLPVMANAKKVVVAACGVSDKYPQGKSAGMRRAVAADDETLQTFPAVGLRSVATWIMDKAAASKLGDQYNA
jgi:hypothetical protein